MTRRTMLAMPVVAAATGCARGRAPDALRMWAQSYEGDYAPLLMPAFTRATGIPVDVQSVPGTAAHEKLLTAHAGGGLPDVFMLPSGWVGEFALIGAAAPVPTPALLADTVPGVLGRLRVGTRDYAVPWSMGAQVQYFRRDILADAGYDTPPSNWIAWREMGLAIKRRRPDDFVFLMLLNWPDTLFTMLFQAGVVPLRDRDTRGNFRSPEAREAFGFYASMFADGLAPAALSTEVQDPLAAFAQGAFAIWPSWPTLLLDLARRSGEIPRDRWGTARLPGPSGPATTTGVSANLCVSTTTRRPNEAWALVRHLTSPSSELRFQRLIGSLPTRASAWLHPQMADQVLIPFAEQLPDIAQPPKVIEWERIQAEVQLFAERAVRGLLTIDQALIAIDARIDAILAKRRRLVEAGRIT